MRQGRKAWYPETPVYLVAILPKGDSNSMADLVHMSSNVIAARRRTDTQPASANRMRRHLEGMIEH